MIAPRGGLGLVLGAGGALGAAWMVGALVALGEVEGYDPAGADVVVGTSAGSVLGALLGSGHTVAELADRLLDSDPQTAGTGPVNAFDVHKALAGVPWPRPTPGNLGLAWRTVRRPARHTVMTTLAGLAPRGRGDLRPLADLIGEASQGRWPTRAATWIVAMDFDSGKRVVFGRKDAPRVPLADAVLASAAAPGFFPPHLIAGRRYVDGGAVSMTNADVLARSGLSQVLVLAPMLPAAGDRRRSLLALADRRLRAVFAARLAVETAMLVAAGTAVRTLGPTAADLAVMGVNMMDPAHRAEVFATAVRTTREQLGSPHPHPDAA